MEEDLNSTNVRTFDFRAPRFEVRFGFTLQIDATGESHDALCCDISEDGLAADIREAIPPRTPVTLSLVLPGSSAPMKIKARIEYRRGNRYGIGFLCSSADENAEVRSFIQSLRG